MRALLATLLLLAAAPVALAQSGMGSAEPDFRQSRWGDLRDAVRRTERGQPTIPFPGTLEYRARVFDRPALVQYDFAGDVLTAASYQFNTDTRGETERLFDDVQDVLEAKYGTPTSCRSIPNTAYRDTDDERECRWDGLGRTQIVLKTNHDPDILSDWHYLWVYYSAEDEEPLVRAGARHESPALFGPGATADSTTALFGLRWGSNEAAVRRVLGAPLSTDDTGTGRRLIYRAPEVAGFTGHVLATYYDGGLQMLFARYESDYIGRMDFAFFAAMMEFVLGTPEVRGEPTERNEEIDLFARWTREHATYSLTYDEQSYQEDYLSILAQSVTAGAAERSDRVRHAGDF